MLLTAIYPGPDLVGQIIYGIIWNRLDGKVSDGSGWIVPPADVSTVAQAATNEGGTNSPYYVLAVPAHALTDSLVVTWYLGVSEFEDVETDLVVGADSYDPLAAGAVNITDGDLNAIANRVLAIGANDIADYASPGIDRYSLAAMILLSLRGDSCSVPGSIVSRDPLDNSIIHTYAVRTGSAKPICGIE